MSAPRRPALDKPVPIAFAYQLLDDHRHSFVAILVTERLSVIFAPEKVEVNI
jgi:hypothetical protein